MRLLRTEKQKDNTAKYLYDISKIIFAVVVIGPLAKPDEVNFYRIIAGIIASSILFIFASYLDNHNIKQ